jgi:predicted aspartyl protease
MNGNNVKSWWWCLTILFCLLNILKLQGQQVRYLKESTAQFTMPFEFHNQFIVVSIRVNGLPLKFIVDTGAEYTILFHREIADWLGLESQRRVRLMGADMETELYARVVPTVSLMLQDQCHVTTPLLVLEEDFFELDHVIGIPVAGILGGGVLRQFAIKIDYTRPELTFYDPVFFKAPAMGFKRIQLEIDRSKPFVVTEISIRPGEKHRVKLLLDTGASLASLLYVRPENGLHIPDTVITGTLGVGLGGALRGYIGKMESLELGDYTFERYLASFQQPVVEDSLLHSFGKDGMIGNGLLSRFNLILDYKNSQLYLKPNRWFRKKIKADRSGLILITTGSDLRRIQVLDVIVGSPAHEAGIVPGDVLLRYNNVPLSLVGYEGLLRRLTRSPGKRVRLDIKRGDSRSFSVDFVLRDLL